MSIHSHWSYSPRQRGAALIVGLLILAVVMLIGVTGMSTTVLQERMTGTQRNESLAFTGSESALRGGELFVYQAYANSDGTLATVVDNAITDGSGTLAAFVNSRTWVSAGATQFTGIDYPSISGTAGGSRLDRSPVYLVERLQRSTSGGEYGTGDGVGWLYRITARSTGGDPRVIRTTESVYMVGR